MSDVPDEITISGQVSLSAEELAEVLALKSVCDAYEGLDLKLGFGAAAPADPTEAAHSPVFLARVGQRLVGYCSLEGDATSAETCGMVHPDWRRKHLGFRLFEAARASFTRHTGGDQLFAVCEDGSASGRAMLRMLAAQRAFSEHRMLWHGAEAEASAAQQPRSGEPAQSSTLSVERARADEMQPLAAALARAFDQSETRLQADLTSAAALATEQVYVARLDGRDGAEGTVIGGFRLSILPDSTGIYAFGVDRAYQRQGLGRRMLAQACALAAAQGAQRVTLEVDTDNAPAIALYRSSGFEIITTYGYYIFSRTLLALGLDGGGDES